jgi:hypothetical protein
VIRILVTEDVLELFERLLKLRLTRLKLVIAGQEVLKRGWPAQDLRIDLVALPCGYRSCSRSTEDGSSSPAGI